MVEAEYDGGQPERKQVMWSPDVPVLDWVLTVSKAKARRAPSLADGLHECSGFKPALTHMLGIGNTVVSQLRR